jgi:hypothetical protein
MAIRVPAGIFKCTAQRFVFGAQYVFVSENFGKKRGDLGALCVNAGCRGRARFAFTCKSRREDASKK